MTKKKFGAFTDEDLEEARRMQAAIKRDKSVLSSPETREWIKRIAAKYTSTAVSDAGKFLHPPTGTKAEFRQAVALWDSGLSCDITFKAHIQRLFPEMTQEEMEKWKTEMFNDEV